MPQKPVRVRRCRRHHHLEARGVQPIGFGGLGMMFHRTDSAERRYPHRHRHVDVAAGAHPVFRQVADDLVERRIREPVELDFGHRYEAADRESDRDADDGGLGQRGVETPLLAECFGQAFGNPEYATELCDVFAEDQHPLVGGHRIVQRPVDRLHHRQAGGGRHRRQQRAARFGRVIPTHWWPVDDLRHLMPPSPTRPPAVRAGRPGSG